MIDRTEEMLHLEILKWIIVVLVKEKTGAVKRMRGIARQLERRRLECEVRLRVVLLLDVLVRKGRKLRGVAVLLGLCSSTLCAWERRWREDQLGARARGRPTEHVDSATRQEILDYIKDLGPTVGLPTLVDEFPHVARGELIKILCDFRDDHLGKTWLITHTLRWPIAGRVWAIDFTKPPRPMDGIYTSIFVVRDLGSGKAIEWMPVRGETGREALMVLKRLFALYGAPLVLKSDNDKAFGIDEIEKLCSTWGVIHLWSPGYRASYNGSCEAGNGTLKTYTHHEAARHDRPEEWTCDDLEASRRRANALARPLGSKGPSPDEAWRERTPITLQERLDFYFCVDTELGKRNYGKNKGIERAAIERFGITAALIACGYLLIRRRRISPRYKTKFCSGIS